MADPSGILTDLVVGARRVVAFTGAGISTESGIPDFRSPGGFWSRHKPVDFAEFLRSAEARKQAWRRKFALDDLTSGARPSRGHRAIAHLAGIGRLTHVITQNIDNLHQASGVPEGSVIELHGNGTYGKCLDCGERHELAWVRAMLEETGTPPDCMTCGGLLKSATISFGQAMPREAMMRAEAASLHCDLFLAIGSSLVVHPANGFPLIAKRNGARLVIVNRDRTELDTYADLVISADIGDTMEPLMALSAS